tara:strand:- start:570 stop:1877 length:1308 start_codon:yes stop_codon:yes gene_type:complete
MSNEEQEPKKSIADKVIEEMASKSIITKIPENMTAMSDIDLLGSMFSIFSPSGDEHAMIAYVTQYLRDAEIEYEIDTAGNIYFANHVEGDKRILLNAHMDTVGSGAPDIIVEHQKNKGTILRSTNNQVIGGDDKCGVFAVLKTINNKAIDTPLSGLLTVSEETGCNGARHAMEHHSDRFKDIVFNITIDRNGNTDIITQNSDYKLCSDVMEKMLNEWGKDFGLKSCNGSISDVSEIVSELNINGINLFAGYYNAHSGKEHVIWEHLMRSLGFIQHILPKLHSHFTLHPEQITFKPTRAVTTWSYGGAYEYYGGIKYYGGSGGWSSVTDDAVEDKLVKFYDALDRIEAEEGQYSGLERLAEDEDVRVSSSGKSIVIPNAYVNYYVEIDILEDYMPVSQNDYDAVIAIADLKQYLKSWNVLDDDLNLDDDEMGGFSA